MQGAVAVGWLAHEFVINQSILLRLLYTNGTDVGLEGHNIPRTSPGRTCEYLYYCELSVIVAEVRSVYARARVLSREQAMAIERLLREFVIEFLDKCMYL